MRISMLALSAALGAFALGTAFPASADDKDKPLPNDQPAPTAKAAVGRTIVFPNNAAKFEVVDQDARTGAMTIRLTDPRVKISEPPVIVLTTPEGPKEVKFTAVEGQSNTWRVTNELLREEALEGSLRIVVDGRTLTAPLGVAGPAVPATAETVLVARHGGRVIAFPECNAQVEVVQDPTTGSLTIWSLGDLKIESPTIILTEDRGAPTTLKVERVENETGAFRVTNAAFRAKAIAGTARLRLIVDGKPCETLLPLSAHGGEIVQVEGGPRFEVVRDVKNHTYVFYALDDQFQGKPLVIEHPTVVVNTDMGPKTFDLVPVPGEPRAWKLVGFEAKGTAPADAHLRFTLFDKSLDTRVGLTGFGVQ